MKHYTDTIPPTLAEKLKEKGMPMQEGGKSMIDWKAPTYGSVFDWMLERDIIISIEVDDCKKDGKWTYDYGYYIGRIIPPNKLVQADFVQLLDTWHEAAEAAIEKALTLI